MNAASFGKVLNYTSNHPVNISYAPNFYAGSVYTGVGVTKNLSQSPLAMFFETNKANTNLSTIRILSDTFYDLMYDPVYYALYGMSQAVNNYGIDIGSIVNRSWVDPKSRAYSNFANKKGLYFSTPDNGDSFYFGKLKLTNDGVFLPPVRLFQPNVEDYVATSNSLAAAVAVIDQDNVTILPNRPIYWGQAGITHVPRLYPIKSTVH
jgi:hypothetical protein